MSAEETPSALAALAFSSEAELVKALSLRGGGAVEASALSTVEEGKLCIACKTVGGGYQLCVMYRYKHWLIWRPRDPAKNLEAREAGLLYTHSSVAVFLVVR